MNVKFDLQDGTLFGNDAGEDETPEILASYFVDQRVFSPFLNKNGRFYVARAKKGMGKSALLSKFAWDRQEESEPIVIKLIGSQVIDEKIPAFSSFLEAQAYWIRNLCSQINSNIGATIGFAFSDTAMSLVEAAEVSGLRERSLLSGLLSRIKVKSIPIEITTSKSPNPAALLERALADMGDRSIWLIVDDIDASFKNDDHHRLVVSSFYSALRYIAYNMKGVVIRASVRSDVWSYIRDVEDLDKCEQYMIDISWTRSELQVILAKKIWAWVARNYPDSAESKWEYDKRSSNLIELVFSHRLRWGGSAVPPFQPINILSAGRPRWMSQLCRLAAARADMRNYSRIQSSDIIYVMPDFTRYRFNDLYKEHGHQFKYLERLISIFSDAPVRYTTDDLLSKINKEFVGPVGSGNIPEINEEKYSAPTQIASLLFQIGFIVARYGESSEASEVEFRTFTDEPDLLRFGRPVNKDIIWEIYPSYRQRKRTYRKRAL